MYRLYLCGEQMPETPEKMSLRIRNKNNTIDLLDGRTINILKSAGLTEIDFTLCFPMFGNQKPDHYLSLLEKFKVKKKPTQLILTRTTPDNKLLFDTNIKVSIEDYTISESHGTGFDVYVDVSLMQYIDYGTEKVTVKTITENGKEQKVADTQKERETSNAPTAKTHTIKSGDTLWAIAAKYLGSGARYTEIVAANKGVITNPNLVPIGTVIKIP